MSKSTLFNVVRNVIFLMCVFCGAISFADTSQKANNLKSVTVIYIYSDGQKIVVSNPHFKRISNPGFIPERYGAISTIKFKKDIKKNEHV